VVPTIYQEIETTKRRPRPRLATRNGRKPRRGLGPPTISSAKCQTDSSRNHKLGALFQRQVRWPLMGKGGRRLLPPTSGRKRDPVRKGQEGIQEKKSHEDTAGERGERKNCFRRGSPGRANLGPTKPTRSRCPNHCGKRQRPRTTGQGEGKTSTSLQSSQTENAPNRSHALERRSLASWDRCKRGKGANVTNGD